MTRPVLLAAALALLAGCWGSAPWRRVTARLERGARLELEVTAGVTGVQATVEVDSDEGVAHVDFDRTGPVAVPGPDGDDRELWDLSRGDARGGLDREGGGFGYGDLPRRGAGPLYELGSGGGRPGLPPEGGAGDRDRAVRGGFHVGKDALEAGDARRAHQRIALVLIAVFVAALLLWPSLPRRHS